MLLLSAIEVILRAPRPSWGHCCLLQTRRSGSLFPLARLHLIPDNHANIPPLNFLQGGCPSCRQTNSVKALKGMWYVKEKGVIQCSGCCQFIHYLYQIKTSSHSLCTTIIGLLRIIEERLHLLGSHTESVRALCNGRHICLSVCRLSACSASDLENYSR